MISKSDIFPVPVFQVQMQETIQHNFNHNEQNVLKDDDSKFTQFVKSALLSINEELKFGQKLVIGRNYYREMQKGEVVDIGNFMPAVWGGILFLDATLKCPNLVLVSPNHFTNWPFTKVAEPGPYSSTSFSLDPMPNTLVLFPGYMNYKFEQKINDEKTSMIIFNVGAIDV